LRKKKKALSLKLVEKGIWTGYRDDIVDEAEAHVAGFAAEPPGGDQGPFVQDLYNKYLIGGLQAVIDRLDKPDSPYFGRSDQQQTMTFVGGKIPPGVYGVPRSK
jgi:hypothetical protein